MTPGPRIIALALGLAATTAATFVATAAASAMQAERAAVAREVRFARGATAATYAGVVRGYGIDRYAFTARAGQRLTVTLDTDRVDALVTHPRLGDTVTLDDPYVLPFDGRYEIRVLQMRAFARRGRQVPYRITIGIR